MEFGQYIKEQRLELGISSRKLSEKVGKSSSYISSIENGHYKPDYKMAYDILKELRIEIPPHKILWFLESLGIEVPSKSDMLFVNRDQQIAIEFKADKNSKIEPNYQKLYEDRQEEVIERLQSIIEQIQDDMDNYPCDYEDCEDDDIFEPMDKFLTTFTTIMLDSEIEIYNKFHQLMELPLQKLNPVQFQELIDFVSNILEYEYVFESGENSKTQKYPHYRAKFKEKNNNPFP